MKLLSRTTQPEDINQCLHVLRDRFLYNEEQLHQLRLLWLTLLSRDIARSAVVYDEAEPRRVLAFGISAPLNQSRFDHIFRHCVALVARSLLEEWSSGKDPFLNEREYASANASDGLNVFTLHNGFSEIVDIGAFPNVLSKLTEAFVIQYAGCRLKASAHEPFGVPPEFGIDLGVQLVDYAESQVCQLATCPVDRKPHIIVWSREHAERHPGHLTMNELFLRFSPPLFAFSAAERRLLRYAIEGESDRRIAEFLQIAPRTIKKRWAEIYLAMETVTGIPSGGLSGRRGAEARRHVLRYIRQHAEELHAYPSLESAGRPQNGPSPHRPKSYVSARAANGP